MACQLSNIFAQKLYYIYHKSILRHLFVINIIDINLFNEPMLPLTVCFLLKICKKTFAEILQNIFYGFSCLIKLK